jgi:tetratricopeptide (TPR) repeat protein
MRRCFGHVPLVIVLLLLYSPSLTAQIGKIIGQIRVVRGDFPSHPILVSLECRGSTVDSTYADSQGKFGFYNLESNLYHVAVNDEGYNPVQQVANLNAVISPTLIVEVSLLPRETSKPKATDRMPGSNINMMDPAEYTRHFPKKTIKEFQKGVDADGQGKHEEAIAHYEKAISLSPDFYPAHNNLGAAELSRSNFAAARREFEAVVKLNQSDATAYFNLSNVSIMTGQLSDAQRFLEEGFRRQPNSAFGQFLLGSLDLRAGKFSEAEKALVEAIRSSPVMPQARLQLVNLFVQQGRKEEAAATLRQFVAAFPKDPFTPKATQLLKKLDPSAQVPKERR